MSARAASAVLGFILMVTSHSPVAFTVSGVTIHVPVPLIAAAAVALACLALTLAAVRMLHGFRSCPHLRTVRS